MLFWLMPKCPGCSVPLDPTEDSLQCDRCSKKFHWPCTKLKNYLIKQHKKNPYKPWRCETCTDKYCIHCEKTFPENSLESICCDKCSYWYHLDCSGLSDSEFEHHLENPSDNWTCKKCINKFFCLLKSVLTSLRGSRGRSRGEAITPISELSFNLINFDE